MANELVDRLAVRRLHGMGVADSHSDSLSVCSILFVELLMFLFGVFWGMCGESSCNVFLMLFTVLWVPISATLCKTAVLMLWHAFMFLGLRLFPFYIFFLLGGSCCFFV
jgi:hypothetical protein